VLTAILIVLALWTWFFMSTDWFEDGKSTVAGGKRKRSRMSRARDLEKMTSSIVVDLNGKGKGKSVDTPITSPKATVIGHRRMDSVGVLDAIEENIGTAPKKHTVPIYRGGNDIT
jgi:hypothetical protein